MADVPLAPLINPDSDSNFEACSATKRLFKASGCMTPRGNQIPSCGPAFLRSPDSASQWLSVGVSSERRTVSDTDDHEIDRQGGSGKLSKACPDLAPSHHDSTKLVDATSERQDFISALILDCKFPRRRVREHSIREHKFRTKGADGVGFEMRKSRANTTVCSEVSFPPGMSL